MVRNGGWLRVVEASISVLLVVGVILSIPYSYDKIEDNRLEKQLQFAMNNIAENISLRAEILNYTLTETPESANNYLIIQRLNASLNNLLIEFGTKIYFKICSANETCNLEIQGNAGSYSIERIVTTNLEKDYVLPRKIRVIALQA